METNATESKKGTLPFQILVRDNNGIDTLSEIHGTEDDALKFAKKMRNPENYMVCVNDRPYGAIP